MAMFRRSTSSTALPSSGDCPECGGTGTVDGVPYPPRAAHPTYHNGVPCWSCATGQYDRWVTSRMSGR